MLDVSLDKIVEAVFGPLDPAPEYKYFVEVDGLYESAFIECSGIKATRDVLEVKEGGVNSYTHKLPGRTSFGNITLRKGIMFSTKLWEWYIEGLSDAKVTRRDITVVQYSSYFNMPARWYNIKNAFPVEWDVSSMRSDSSTFAVESLTLAFETLEAEKWSIIDFAAKFAV
jgi:phage tail-like protein